MVISGLDFSVYEIKDWKGYPLIRIDLILEEMEERNEILDAVIASLKE